MWDLNHKECWVLKNWCFWTVVLEKTLESPLDCKESKPVNTKGHQLWIFIGRIDTEAEASVLWSPDVKNQPWLEKTLMLGKTEGKRRRGRQRLRCLDSITNSWSLLKLMSFESIISSNHLILGHPPFLLPSIFPRIWAFSNESVLQIRWPKYWSFSFSISPSKKYSGLISFRMDWLDLLALQGTL